MEILLIAPDLLGAIHDSRRWAVAKIPNGNTWAVGLVVPKEAGEVHHRAMTLYEGDEPDCRAFFSSLAVRLGAWRWDSDKRCFVRVWSEDVNG